MGESILAKPLCVDRESGDGNSGVGAGDVELLLKFDAIRRDKWNLILINESN